MCGTLGRGVVLGYFCGVDGFDFRGVSVVISVSDDIVIALTSFIV